MKYQIPLIDKIISSKNGIGLLNEHHLLGLLPNHLAVSSFHEESLSQYKKQWIHNQLILFELENLNVCAAKYEAMATLLKGSHLLLDLYQDLGSRFLSDVDLLIPNCELSKWELVLTTLDFVPIQNKTFYGNNFKKVWSKTIGKVELNIELHTKLFFHLEIEDWKTESTTFSNLTKLTKEDLFIHLSGHLAFQHTFSNLNWLFDIFFFYKKYYLSMDWNYLKIKSMELKLLRSVQMCLWAIRQYLDVNLEDIIVKNFEVDKYNWWNELLTDTFLINPDNRNIQYYFLKHATKDHLVSALRYDLKWFYHYKIQKLWLK